MTAPVGDDLTWLDDLERAHAAATWRHLRYIEPHPAVPVEGTTYIGPGGRVESRCATCADGEAIWSDFDPVAAVNAVPTLIAELRKRDAALSAVAELASRLEGLVDDETVDETARMAHAWTLRRLIKATAALTPESVTT